MKIKQKAKERKIANIIRNMASVEQKNATGNSNGNNGTIKTNSTAVAEPTEPPKDAKDLLPHLESLERIIKLPVVNAAWDKSQDVYGKVKGKFIRISAAFPPFAVHVSGHVFRLCKCIDLQLSCRLTNGKSIAVRVIVADYEKQKKRNETAFKSKNQNPVA